jgi:uncharacterized paraquat-inducible protein A
MYDVYYHGLSVRNIEVIKQLKIQFQMQTSANALLNIFCPANTNISLKQLQSHRAYYRSGYHCHAEKYFVCCPTKAILLPQNLDV